MASPTKDVSAAKAAPKPLPVPNSDFYGLAETLPAEDLATIKQVRAFMETKVAPIITKSWVEDSVPFEILPAMKEPNLGGVGLEGNDCKGVCGLRHGWGENVTGRNEA